LDIVVQVVSLNRARALTHPVLEEMHEKGASEHAVLVGYEEEFW
jgi:hypothetical protein